MRTHTTASKPQILIKRIYQHDIQKIWTALTTKEALSSWLMETVDFELKEGHTFQFKTTPRRNFDGIVNCEVLSFDAPHLLSISWRANKMPHPTFVLWELKRIGEGQTMFTLSHTGFEGFNGWITRRILSFGWKKLLKRNLSTYLDT
ncbi:MAG: SRPBCC domain-containing protein [Bacteroidota bacterium]